MPSVLRFMSGGEAILLIMGNKLHSTTDHSNWAASDSKGFCFAEPEIGLTRDQAIYAAAKYLSGIADMEVCLVGDFKPGKLKRGLANYTVGLKQEYSIEKYSLEDFDDWAMYGHSQIDREIMLRLAASPWWQKPVYLSSKQELT